MNVEKINALISHLETVKPKNFNMAYYLAKIEEDDEGDIYYHYMPARYPNDCGTAACLAGHLFIMENPESETLTSAENYDYYSKGKEALGLTEMQASSLFLPIEEDLGDTDVLLYRLGLTKAQAIDTLNRLMETGEVEWQYA